MTNFIHKTNLLLSVLICLLALCAPYAHAATENLQYNYDDDRQIREVTYEDDTAVNYSYDTRSNRLTKDIDTSSGTNNEPSAPSVVFPEHEDTDVDLPVTLSWAVSTDSDAGDVVSYDIYLGTTTDPPLIASGYQPTAYPVDLEPGTSYFWKVVARDNHNATTVGDEWNFTTKNVPSVPLIADFSLFPNNVIGNVTVYFTDISTSYNNSITTWAWDLDGDGNSDSSEQNPTFDYNPSATTDYTIKLTIADAYGRNDFEEKIGYLRIYADSDGDGIANELDNCPDDYNPDQLDTDDDYNPNNPQPTYGGDACDTDIDGDGNLNEADNCILISNYAQHDMDNDDIGDACDLDMDGDGIYNGDDNCQITPNGPDLGTCVGGDYDGLKCPPNDCTVGGGYCSDNQEASNDNGLGDACIENDPQFTCIASGDSTALQEALDNAKTNNKNDIIRLVEGTYSVADKGDTKFEYYTTTEFFSLIIQGGYDTGCNTRTIDPRNTIIDGLTSQKERVNPVLKLFNANTTDYEEWLMVRNTLLEVDGITVQNGQGGFLLQSSKGDITVLNSIARNNISSSSPSAIYIKALEGIATLQNSIVRNNSTVYKTGVYLFTDTGKIIMTNNVIAGNKASAYAAGAYILVSGENGEAHITNNTITENRAAGGVAGGMQLFILKASSVVELHNNIIYDNIASSSGNDLYITSTTGTVNAYNNDIGEENDYIDNEVERKNVNPEFILSGEWSGDDWSEGDYRLKAISLIIDEGNNSAPSLPDTDLSGNPRIINNVVDIGAYEASGITITPEFGDYGYTTVDIPAYKTFRVLSNVPGDIFINSISAPAGPFSISEDLCTGETINTTTDCTIQVEFLPPNNELHSGSFVINSTKDTVNRDLPVNLVGIGNFAPVAVIVDPPDTNEGVQICFNGSASYDSDGTIDLYEWDIDDDGTYEYSPSSSEQCHTYYSDDDYTVRLRVTDNHGATVEDTMIATILDTGPNADFEGTPENVEIGNAVSFTNFSTGNDEPLTYEWDFNNDGTPDSEDAEPSHIYDTAGIYTVKLTAFDSDDPPDSNSYTRTNYITVSAALNVSVSGNGSVISTPLGIDCGLDCAETFTVPVVTLTAIPESGDYEFFEWSGDCSGTDDECVVTMDDSKSVTATFATCTTNPVRIPPSSYFTTLQQAYNAATNGDTIQSRDSVFIEDLIYNNTASTTLEGGYDCIYSYISGVTTVQSSMTVQNGKVTIYDYHIEEGAGGAMPSAPEGFMPSIGVPIFFIPDTSYPTSTPAMIE